jgi:hypothetical protein
MAVSAVRAVRETVIEQMGFGKWAQNDLTEAVIAQYVNSACTVMAVDELTTSTLTVCQAEV